MHAQTRVSMVAALAPMHMRKQGVHSCGSTGTHAQAQTGLLVPHDTGGGDSTPGRTQMGSLAPTW